MTIIRFILLFAVSGILLGCATSADVSENPPSSETTPSHDDTHGWGANLQSMGGR